MLYELILYFPNGSHHALLEDVVVHDGYVHGKMIGELTAVDSFGSSVFTSCEPRDYYAGGTYSLIEFKGKVVKSS